MQKRMYFAKLLKSRSPSVNENPQHKEKSTSAFVTRGLHRQVIIAVVDVAEADNVPHLGLLTT